MVKMLKLIVLKQKGQFERNNALRCKGLKGLFWIPACVGMTGDARDDKGSVNDNNGRLFLLETFRRRAEK